MFLASAIALVGISVAAVFFGLRQLRAPRVQPAAPQAASYKSSPPAPLAFDAQIAAEMQALQAVMYRKAPKPIMTAIVIIILQDILIAFVTYLFIVTFVPPVAVSMTMLFYAMLPLFCAFGLWEGRRWAWRFVMVMYGGTIAALPRLADDVITEVLAGEELVYIIVGVAWQLAVIIPLWMPASRAWCRPIA